MLIELTKENSGEILGTCLARFLHCSLMSLDLKYNVPVPAVASVGGAEMDIADQYVALRRHIVDTKMAAVHAGMSAFYDSKHHERYTVYSYVMYVRPPDVYRGSESFDLATMVALAADNFDFNAYFRAALPYLNRRDENRLRRELHQYAVVPPAQRRAVFAPDSFLRRHIDSKRIQKLVTEQLAVVCQWLEHARPGDNHVLEDTDYRDVVAYYILRKEVVGLFRTVWASTRGFKMCVDNVLCMRRGKYETDEHKLMKQEGYVVDSMTSFSRLVRHLFTLEVTLVGHDLLLALMVLHNMVEDELPESYEAFVSGLSMRCRPVDTRRLSAAMRAGCRPADRCDSLDLEPTYHYLKNGAGLPLTCDSRFVVGAEDRGGGGGGGEVSDVRLRYAGTRDAYKAGYLYAKLEYFLAQRAIEVTPLFVTPAATATTAATGRPPRTSRTREEEREEDEESLVLTEYEQLVKRVPAI